MCIVAIAWKLFDNLPLVILSNRDEYKDRPTLPAHQWADKPIFAGRDQQNGGTWLGFQQNTDGGQNGRWGVVLNFRDGVVATSEQISRGMLVSDFLTGNLSPIDFARQLDLQSYAGFNLIIGDDKQAVVINNRGYPPTPLYSGLHIFSNGQPESAWFKCERLRGRVRQEVLPLIAENNQLDYWQSASFDVLSDSQQAPIDQLPNTGIPLPIEQLLSSVFIRPFTMPNQNSYGTRTQSILYRQQSVDNKQLALVSKEVG